MNHLLLLILFNFAAGTACLIFGVRFMSRGLEESNTRRIRAVLTRFTSRLIPAFITGTVVTALVQSSAAVTVITVGFVNSGLLKLTQAVGIIYGANIGTTITAQLMSFRLTKLAIPTMVLGAAIRLLARKKTVKSLALSLTGLGLMFTGINILSSGAPLIKESRYAYELFMNYGSNPYLGLVIGMITTMLVQSSSATVGFTIVLFNSGLISLDTAIGLTLGDNIGTCITAQLASMGTGISARRTAWAHTLYNVIGVAAVLLLLGPFTATVRTVTDWTGQDNTRLVANTHTLFNLLSAAVFLPLTGHYVRFIEWVVREKKEFIRRL